jgi:hypothetical protein
MNPPSALPMPIPINSVAALSPVRVKEEVVDAPLTISTTALPSQAPTANPINEKALTSNPRRQPDTRINIAKAIRARSK